ncbi:MAG: response regulator transcription factor [Caldilineaceae bacterium SB0668_bin_21]|nr:response regulator transcription factor [Caldilineaceae bacterium SB0668_bin_21]MYC19929.1 response regulator transcription factor [Caldilineaceae bacterium SB0662_bin_25]
MFEKISLLLVDDQELLREGMRIILNLEEDIAVVGEAGNGQEAISLYDELRPDVVLMDVRMPVMDGISAVRYICRRDPEAKIIILTTFDNDEYVFEGIRAGALNYTLKATSSEHLATAVRTAHRGDSWLDVAVARKIINEFVRQPPPAYDVSKLAEPLSERELEILRLLRSGCRNSEIAEQLHLAEGTVRNYVSALMGKLNVRDRTQAVLRAKELGLV